MEDQVLLQRLLSLREEVLRESEEYLRAWGYPGPKLNNLAHYLALRRHDLRELQVELAWRGLSSLGRCESRVLPNLDAVIATLGATLGLGFPAPTKEEFFAGDIALSQNGQTLFGKAPSHRQVRIMVTLPTEAATDPGFLSRLLAQGMDLARINLAHDQRPVWERMLLHLRQAEAGMGRACPVQMDLAGPKIRTGAVLTPPSRKKVFAGDRIRLTPGPPRPDPRVPFQVEVVPPEVLAHLREGSRVWIDDAKIAARVVQVEASGVLVEVETVKPSGKRLREEKGLNFPDTDLHIPPLTERDIEDLKFVAQNAQLVGYSFVQRPEEVRLLLDELDRIGAPPGLGVVLKVETRLAVRNLPALIAAAVDRRPVGVMIARGDLAAELGWLRLGEIQEELLWICEAAHAPLIWATQVLENLVKEGTPSRAELSDAALAARAECVMVNKGPYVAEAVALLDQFLTRMQAHQHKKTSRLRPLYSWQ
ncbi:pyruvate kinase [Thermus sediminis]|uniref:pyruvate kinase n=1 Tax=Thermus sediminis TaxID=1761908 RepID=UPI0018E4FF07|nr:pyruvate kinase [Thermus sediminis]